MSVIIMITSDNTPQKKTNCRKNVFKDFDGNLQVSYVRIMRLCFNSSAIYLRHKTQMSTSLHISKPYETERIHEMKEGKKAREKKEKKNKNVSEKEEGLI